MEEHVKAMVTTSNVHVQLDSQGHFVKNVSVVHTLCFDTSFMASIHRSTLIKETMLVVTLNFILVNVHTFHGRAEN